MAHPKMSVEQRFMKYVEKTDTCWNWKGCLFTHSGYGQFSFNGENCGSHRVSYELFNGKIPKGLWILHSCDNRICVNPAHLRVGTPQDNSNDVVLRNRQGNQNGENNGSNKLMEHDVREIMVLHGFGFTDLELGKQFNVSRANITYIVNRKSWKHLLL